LIANHQKGLNRRCQLMIGRMELAVAGHWKAGKKEAGYVAGLFKGASTAMPEGRSAASQLCE